MRGVSKVAKNFNEYDFRDVMHCKYFIRNISGFYACVIISCTIVVLITALGCAQLSDKMNLISCTLFVSIATNRR